MDAKTRLLIKVAKLYYENSKTQDEIAKQLRISRPKVSRLLSEAREAGVVQITIASEPGDNADLEQNLEEKFDLKEVIIADIPEGVSPQSLIYELGSTAAEYFHRIVQDGDTIGLSWGSTLAAMVNQLSNDKKQRVHVVQMVGGLGVPSSEAHATDLARRVSQIMDASLNLMPAPGVVASSEVRDILLQDPYIQKSLHLAGKVDIAFVGIGTPMRDSVLMKDERILTWQEVDNVQKLGAVGDIALRFFDEEGKCIQSGINERVIGISLDDLRELPRIVGIAGGEEKIKAIRGALLGRLINILITDKSTARALLD